ncbi:MAG: hypothetical protein JXR13_14385 [Thalassovita sp.]
MNKHIRRRNFLVSGSALLLANCTTSSSDVGGYAKTVARQQKTLQLTIVVGAALGYAVARHRGGSALAGVAIGAFAGTIASASQRYAQLLLRETNSDLRLSFDRLESSVAADTETFQTENLPAINERISITQSLSERGNTDFGSYFQSLDELEEYEARQTIPNSGYSWATEIYPHCLIVLPKQTIEKTIPPAAKGNADRADDAISRNTDVVVSNVYRNSQALKTLEGLGIRHV